MKQNAKRLLVPALQMSGLVLSSKQSSTNKQSKDITLGTKSF